MTPADQCLKAGNPAAFKVEDRLVVKLELFIQQCLPKLPGHDVTLLGRQTQGMLIKTECAASTGF